MVLQTILYTPAQTKRLPALTGVLEGEKTTLDAVGDNVPRLEDVRAPGSPELVLRVLIVLRVNIKETNFPNLLSSRVLGDTRNIEDPKPGSVVGLVGKAINDILAIYQLMWVSGSKKWNGEAYL